ncbi:MAG: DUF5615 family PIN-like protein [Candidatus Uhrbacteria bacterium]|nr:DUF5615 family PIN-like protein [Candidatus Uhrbacteria bacterium]
MKLLVDENVDIRIVKILREKGFDVLSIYETSPSITDNEVLEIATREGRLVVTGDLDFSHVLSLPTRDHHGICLLRTKISDYHTRALHLLVALDQLKDTPLKGRIVVVRENQLRIYP